MTQDLISTREALAILGVTAPTLKKAATKAGFKYTRDPHGRGRPAYWRRQDIEFLAAQRRGGGSDA